MEYKGPMVVVKDMEKSKEFYKRVLKLDVIMDLGANVTIEGGFSLQTEESWIQFTGSDISDFSYGGNDVEFYFEQDDFDGFMEHLEKQNIEIIDDVAVMPWGQKVIRFYDPDKHIIQVGEDLIVMVKNMKKNGMNIDEITTKTGLEKKMIENMLSMQ